MGGYQLLGEVARGGQGAVFRARRPDGAEVALKLLLDLEPESLARFEREALGLARIQHPHVVRVHDYGREGRKPYLVMEWIEGETLSDRVRRQGPLPAPDALQVVGEVASALAHCHALGIVHRDLKPQNVVLQPGRGAVLVDFGLVRELGGSGGELAQRLTVTGEILGTPSYMAPEQADASFGVVSSASDVYALGATLYFALTGSPPLECQGGLTAVLIALLEERPRDPRELQPGIPGGLAALCLRSLAKRPQDRPRDAGQFLAELNEAVAEAPAPQRLVWVAGVLVLALTLGLVGIALAHDPGATVAPSPSAPISSAEPPSVVTSPATPAESEPPSPSPARVAPTASEAVLESIFESLARGRYGAARTLIKGALEESPQDVRLLQRCVDALGQAPEGKRPAAFYFDLLCRLQALEPELERGLEISDLALAQVWAQPRAEQRRWLERGLTAAESSPDSEARELRLARGRLHSELALRLSFEGEWKATGEQAGLAQDLLAPIVAPGGPAAGALAAAIGLRFRARLELGVSAEDFSRRVAEAVRGLEPLCEASGEDPGPHGHLADVYASAASSGVPTREARVGYREAAARAYEAARRAAPVSKRSRGNYLIFAWIQRAQSEKLRGRFGEAQLLLEGAFAIPEASTGCKGGALKNGYLNGWKAWLGSRQREEGEEALRQALAKRPWASDQAEDAPWIADLERKLRALLPR